MSTWCTICVMCTQNVHVLHPWTSQRDSRSSKTITAFILPIPPYLQDFLSLPPVARRSPLLAGVHYRHVMGPVCSHQGTVGPGSCCCLCPCAAHSHRAPLHTAAAWFPRLCNTWVYSPWNKQLIYSSESFILLAFGLCIMNCKRKWDLNHLFYCKLALQ